MYRKIKKLYNIRKRITIALFLREAKSRFGNNKFSLMWALLEPIFQVGIFAIIFLALKKQGPHGSDVFTFLIPGIIIFQIFSKVFARCMDAIDANKTLLSYPIMKPFDTILARALLEFIIYNIIFLFFIYFLFYYEFIEKIYRFDFMILPISLAFIMGLSLGTFIAALSSLFNSITKIVGVINRFLFLSSGIFFSASMLPQFAREILWWNPLLHLTEMIRYSLIEGFPEKHFSVMYVSFWTLSALAIGLLMLHLAERNPNAKIRGVA